jgi:hypothetical protein
VKEQWTAGAVSRRPRKRQPACRSLARQSASRETRENGILAAFEEVLRPSWLALAMLLESAKKCYFAKTEICKRILKNILCSRPHAVGITRRPGSAIAKGRAGTRFVAGAGRGSGRGALLTDPDAGIADSGAELAAWPRPGAGLLQARRSPRRRSPDGGFRRGLPVAIQFCVPAI